jgi:hypothetical protein
MTMMCLISIKLPPSATSALFKVLMVKVPHIAWCFQAGLMGLIWKEMHLFLTVENINTLNVAPVGIQEVATHPMPPSQPRQLFKSPANVPRRSVCI